jgi:hypothetical protein
MLRRHYKSTPASNKGNRRPSAMLRPGLQGGVQIVRRHATIAWMRRALKGVAVRLAVNRKNPCVVRCSPGTAQRCSSYASRLVLGDPANPRKTGIASLSRRMSSSSRRPICEPILDFGTGVILSTISRQTALSPPTAIRLHRQTEQRRFGRVRGERANGDRVGQSTRCAPVTASLEQ